MKPFFRRLPWMVLLTCLAGTAPAADLVSSGAEWRYFKGTTEASSPDVTAWRQDGFDDSGWLSGPATFWYGNPFTGTEVTDMLNGYSTLFFRRQFTVVNKPGLTALNLHAQCDDGFIAWINGVEVARFNVPAGDLAHDAFASAPVSPDPAVFSDYPLANPQAALAEGQNTLAVQVFNVALTSSDIVWDAALQATLDDTAPVVANRYPTNGATVRELLFVEVEFSREVTGVDAGDLLVNGLPATALKAVNPAQYVFSFPPVPAGPVTLAFRPDHGITGLGGIPPALDGFRWGCVVDPVYRPPGLELSEFMADNRKGIRDEDDDRADWIELHNGSTLAQSLAGWSLTDDAAARSQWRFPDLTMEPGAYLLVYASGKDRTNTAGKLHTNFKLGSGGGFLALVSPDGERVSDFGPSYPPQRPDVSYGRAVGAGDTAGYFLKPTPGAANSMAGAGFAPDVDFSVTGGTFQDPFALTLAPAGNSPSPGAVIYYTTNGTLPTEASLPYAGPISITNSVRIRTRAFAAGLLPGSPHSESFLRLAPVVAAFKSDLPVIVIHNFGAGRPPDTGSEAAEMQVFEPVNGVTSLTNRPTLTVRTGVGARGSSTIGNAKVNMTVEFHDDFEASLNRPLLGLPADSDWVLYGPDSFEPVLIHNPFMHQLSRDIGRYSSRTRFVEVYLVMNNVSGQVAGANYWGIYALEEKIKRGRDRVDVDGLTAQDTRPPQVTGGYMMKIDRTGPAESGFNAAHVSGIVYVDPKEREMKLPERAAQKQYLQGYMNAFGTALYTASWKNPTNGYAAFIDTPAWIDNHLLNVLALNVDALRLSANFYKPRNGKLTFGPLWDFDRALGSTDGRDKSPKIWSGTGGGTDFFNETTQFWWGRLFQDLEFYQRYIDRYQELRRAQFATTNLWRLVDDLTGQIRLAQPRERTRWGGSYRTASGDIGGNYATETQWMKNWLSNRVTYIDVQFVSPAAITTPAGRFTNSLAVVLEKPANGTVYYTLDGTDPRLPGGTPAPGAMVSGSAPILITGNARLVARVQNLRQTAATGANNPPLISKWSGPVAASFYNQLPRLLFTEIMFHPAPAPAGSTNTAGDFEFLELKNTSAQPLNLAGFQLQGTVAFTFSGNAPTLAPQGRLLLVSNQAAFLTRYPGVTGIAGEYTGQLANGDGHLRLTGPLGEPVSDFTYQQDWAPLADGFGFSLVLQNEVTRPNHLGNGAQWRRSTRAGGSPGAPEAALAGPNQPVLVNEALAHSEPPLLDAIELYNSGTAPQDLGGWWLSDDYRTPKKFRIPAGTVVAADGYVVFDENQFHAGTAGNVAFALGAQGDEVHLFSGEATGELTGYHHGLAFDASFNGVSLGRHVTSDGRELFVPQLARTLGSANASPQTGPVVFTEIHYDPAADGNNGNPADEFIELRNVTVGPVALFDPAHPTNRWRVRGAVHFDFPANTTLPGDGFALIVGFDPLTNATQLAVFRDRFHPPVTTPIFGPWQGLLNNAGESLRLLAPDVPLVSPDPNAGAVPFVPVDEVRYRPDAPWPPEAAGTGKSLQRVSSRQFGDDPANWFAAVPSAGRPNLALDFLSADADGDGLPDAWETAHGLDPHSAVGPNGAAGDPDGDGFTNAQEYAAGTDPLDSASRLELRPEAGGGRRLRFPAQAGRSYTVHGRAAFGERAWQILRLFPVQTAPTMLEFADPDTETPRYYRVTTP